MWSSLRITCWPSLNNLPLQEKCPGNRSDPQNPKPQGAEKPKVSKLKKLEEETKSPPRREDSREEKIKCKFCLSEQGCRRGKACNWSHDQKDERRRCWNCGSPACTRPKERGDASPTKPKIQKVEGEDSSSTSSKVKEDEGSTEGPSMKELLEQANIMLKSLTTTAASSTATGSATDSREDVVDRLQSQLDQLKLKVFKINQISYGSLQGLVDSGATHPLRPRRLGEGDETCKRVCHTGQWRDDFIASDPWRHHGD